MSESKNIILALANKQLMSFRRAGITVGHKPVVLAMSDISEKQIKALQDEPNIKVTIENTDESDKSDINPVTAQSLIPYIVQLNPDDKALWTSGGKPQAKALTEACGQEVSATLRDEAFALYEAQMSAAQTDQSKGNEV